MVKGNHYHFPMQDDSGDPGPSSPGWRRSSSYEQLANSLLDTPTFHTPSVLSGSMEVIPRGNVTTPQRKALTLSMAGSEAESIYGELLYCLYDEGSI